MKKTIKKNITGATPKETLEYLLIYKDGVTIPIDHFRSLAKEIDKNEKYTFVIQVHNDKIYIESAD